MMNNYTKEDIVGMLETDVFSADFYKLIERANDMSRKQYGNKGYIFAQIGLNAAPCSGGCKFCSLGCNDFCVEQSKEMDEKELKEWIASIDFKKIEALFLMTTADYDRDKFLRMCSIAKEIIPENVVLVANIGDFDFEYAELMKKCGVSAVYHIVRLGEGRDTALSIETRESTIAAIKQAGLELYYCIEPIGREHTYEEIAKEILRAKTYGVDVMAVMSRVPVKGTSFENIPEISEQELAKIAAITRIVCNPHKSMNVHEPKMIPMLAGVNQLYAEIGINPRDNKSETSKGRGYSVAEVENMLGNAGYIV